MPPAAEGEALGPRPAPRSAVRWLFALGLAAAAGLLWVGIASAHSRLARAEPAPDAVLTTPPARVDLWFSQELFRRTGENAIQVSGPDGRLVSQGAATLDDDDRTHLWVALEAGLPAGQYRVTWKNLSLEDGHSDAGDFSFTIDPQAVTASPPSSPAPTAAASAPASTTGPCAAGLAPALALAGYGFGRRTRFPLTRG